VPPGDGADDRVPPVDDFDRIRVIGAEKVKQDRQQTNLEQGIFTSPDGSVKSIGSSPA
jgi:hypothetical protein